MKRCVELSQFSGIVWATSGEPSGLDYCDTSELNLNGVGVWQFRTIEVLVSLSVDWGRGSSKHLYRKRLLI